MKVYAVVENPPTGNSVILSVTTSMKSAVAVVSERDPSTIGTWASETREFSRRIYARGKRSVFYVEEHPLKDPSKPTCGAEFKRDTVTATCGHAPDHKSSHRNTESTVYWYDTEED